MSAVMIEESRRVSLNSYSPYSRMKVGASVVSGSGKIYSGCNVENASYGLSICAERVAISSAISAGESYIEKICITSTSSSDEFSNQSMPCGACLQFMLEFSGESLIVIVDGIGEFKLSELLPKPFKSVL